MIFVLIKIDQNRDFFFHFTIPNESRLSSNYVQCCNKMILSFISIQYIYIYTHVYITLCIYVCIYVCVCGVVPYKFLRNTVSFHLLAISRFNLRQQSISHTYVASWYIKASVFFRYRSDRLLYSSQCHLREERRMFNERTFTESIDKRFEQPNDRRVICSMKRIDLTYK